MVLYKEFKVGELFEPYLPRNKKLDKKERGRYPLICGSGVNNGIDGYTDEEIDVYENELTMSTRGSSGATFYQEGKFVLNNNSMVLKLKEEYPKNKGALIYISTHLNKLPYEGYSSYPTKSGIVKDVLELPVKTLEDNEPDWEYMEEYIKQKELAYIGILNKEFEQKKEQLIEIIGEESEYINIEELPTAKFKVGDFMEMTPGKRVTKNKQVKGDVPYVTALTTNNGIDNYISNPPFVTENIITISFIGDGFYHPYKLSFKDGTYGFKMKVGYMETQSNYLYLLTMIEKQTKKLGSYSNAVRGEQILDFEIELPVNPEVTEIVPDWDAMERYIARIELQLLNRITNTLNK